MPAEPTTPSPTDPSPASSPAALLQLRRMVNIVVPLLLGSVMLLAMWPSGQLGPRLRPAHDRLIELMRPLSLSQSWSMYAPDPGRGHHLIELVAHDADGTVRVLEDPEQAQDAWGTAFFWQRTRMDIWRYTVSGRVDEANRNRTWFLRGICVLEARRGYDVKRIELTQAFRRIRTPEQVREGKALLGPIKRRKAQDGSCRVQIIREMIEADARHNPPPGALDD